ncbi:helix-turn-helix transcriptional regulator [Actinomadura kijaniata]|uniref:Transcriptional regulator with XRE-family HTH domain n=1 Tax=Actinomadura namibiensis TaxID=182080 RepID=A0A7W3LU72_ACTNM|nr:helix-turn-helix transcriptional regulator [Actinomadura namibiensis]MBA8954322.1 transcriptional regulator with XRE-family HTH domain [Actinomadura namibiensis]
MPSSSSSSAQRARQALADQLREIRQSAGLTAKELARRAGWHGNSKVSKIEHGTRPVSAEDVRTWCRVCGVSERRTEELLAEQRSVAGMWTSYQRLNRAGLRQAQQSVRPIYEQATLIRSYQSRTFPGLIQTAAFLTTTLEQVRLRQGVHIDDVAAAVAERVDRQRILREGQRRFVFILEEAVLRYRLTGPAAHAEQLGHLLEVMELPAVSLGIVPLDADRIQARPTEGFVIFDDEQVSVELVSGYLKLTQPKEVEAYVRQFSTSVKAAVFGRRARALIADALAALA